MWPRFLTAICLCLVTALPLRAAGPEEMVQWIYSSFAAAGPENGKGLAYLAQPAHREQYFSARMIAFIAANESYLAQNLPGCISYPMEAAGPDYHPDEMLRTLTLDSLYQADREIVTASFRNNGEVFRIDFVFADDGGIWKIDDIAGPKRRISLIDCQMRGSRPAGAKDGKDNEAEKEVPAYTGAAVEYCYQTTGDRFLLDVSADGNALLWLKSAQPTGHACEVKGKANWAGAGWVYEADLSGGRCKLEILITASSGMRLVDEDFNCKASLCGPRAVLDGMTFERGSQINCTYMRME